MLEERLAMNTVLSANQLADWYFHDLKAANGLGPSLTSPKQLREHLVSSKCSDYKIIWDVADSHKHFHIDRSNAMIDSAGQTKIGNMGWGEGGDGEEPFGGGLQLLVEYNGTKRNLYAATKNVIAMWESILK